MLACGQRVSGKALTKETTNTSSNSMRSLQSIPFPRRAAASFNARLENGREPPVRPPWPRQQYRVSIWQNPHRQSALLWQVTPAGVILAGVPMGAWAIREGGPQGGLGTKAAAGEPREKVNFMWSLVLLSYAVLLVMFVFALCLAAKRQMPACAYVAVTRGRAPRERVASLFEARPTLTLGQRVCRSLTLPCLLYASRSCDGQCEDRICESAERISRGQAIHA